MKRRRKDANNNLNLRLQESDRLSSAYGRNVILRDCNKWRKMWRRHCVYRHPRWPGLLSTSNSQVAHTRGVMLFKRSPTRPDFEVNVNTAHTGEQHWSRVGNGLQHPVHTYRSSKSRGCGEAQRNSPGNVVHSEKTDLKRSPQSDALNTQPREGATLKLH